MWDKPIAKYWDRVLRIAACGLSAFYSILAYNTYAVPCLEYLCQTYWVPPFLLKLEARAIAKILRIPHYAYGTDGPYQLKQIGLLSARSLLCCNLAAMFRASCVTLSGWTDTWSILVSSLPGLTLEGDLSKTMSHPCWDNEPIAARLFCA